MHAAMREMIVMVATDTGFILLIIIQQGANAIVQTPESASLSSMAFLAA
jgi:hypothetical protein